MQRRKLHLLPHNSDEFCLEVDKIDYICSVELKSMMITEQDNFKRYDSPEQYAEAFQQMIDAREKWLEQVCEQETQNKAEYIVIFISEFAHRFGLSTVQAYRYLNRYKAIDFLDEQYNVAHTQSFEDMVQNMAGYCQRHGGALA